eukprot:scaffold64134_cov124-Phaeocystis_antarctica.AAC.1
MNIAGFGNLVACYLGSANIRCKQLGFGVLDPLPGVHTVGREGVVTKARVLRVAKDRAPVQQRKAKLPCRLDSSIVGALFRDCHPVERRGDQTSANGAMVVQERLEVRSVDNVFDWVRYPPLLRAARRGGVDAQGSEHEGAIRI